MAKRAAIIEIILTVKDRATKKLGEAERAVSKLGKSTKRTGNAFVQFNRNLFTATALLGTFALGISRIWDLGQLGADFALIRDQFDAQIGRGFLPQLRKTTKDTIDNVTLMREAIFFKKSGGDLKQMPLLFGLAREAAVTFGKQPQQFIRGLTTAVTNLNLKQLESMGIITRGNIPLQLQQKLISKASSGWALYEKKAILVNEILRQMQLKWGANLRGARTLKDILLAVGASSTNFKQKLGFLIGDALRPLAVSVINVFRKMETWIDLLGESRTSIIQTIRAVIKFTTVLGVLFVTVSLFKLLFFSFGGVLKTAGILFGIMALSAAGFEINLRSIGDIIERVSVFFSFFWQIIKNFKDGRTLLDLDTWNKFNEFFPGIALHTGTILRHIQTWKRAFNDLKPALKFMGDTIKTMVEGIGIMLRFTSNVVSGFQIRSDLAEPAKAQEQQKIASFTGGIFKGAAAQGGLEDISPAALSRVQTFSQQALEGAGERGEGFRLVLERMFDEFKSDGISREEFSTMLNVIRHMGETLGTLSEKALEETRTLVENTSKPARISPSEQQIK